jgi:hypothetical protein
MYFTYSPEHPASRQSRQRNTPPSELIVPPSNAAITFLMQMFGKENGKLGIIRGGGHDNSVRERRRHPISERSPTVIPCPFANPGYAVN